jgi:hypothetical protein
VVDVFDEGNPRQGSPAYTISPDTLVGSNNALVGHVTSDAPERVRRRRTYGERLQSSSPWFSLRAD